MKLAPSTPYEGWVEKQPPLAKGEKRVLGQTLHPNLAKVWEECHKEYLADLPHRTRLVVVVCSDDSTPELDKLIEDNMLAYLQRHIQVPDGLVEGSKQWVQQLLSRLPKGIKVDSNVEPFLVAADDPRTGLRKQLGARVCKIARKNDGPIIRKGQIIGPYRGYLSYGRDYLDNLFNAPKGYPYPTCEWSIKCDSYAVDLQDALPIMPIAAVTQPTAKKGSSAGKRRTPAATKLPGRLASPSPTNSVEEEAAAPPSNYLVCSAYMYGNLMALINDNLVNPHNRTPPFGALVREANVCVRDFRIGPFTYPFVCAIEDLYPDDELVWRYGDGYWELNRRGMHFCRTVAEKDTLLEQQAARIAALEAELCTLKGNMQGDERAAQQQIESQACGAEHPDPEDASTSEALLPHTGDEREMAQLLRLRDLAAQVTRDPDCRRAMQLNLELSDAEAGPSQRLADTPDATATSQLAANRDISQHGGGNCDPARLVEETMGAAHGSRGDGTPALRGVQEAAGNVQCDSGAKRASHPAEAECDDELDVPLFARWKKQLHDAGQPAAAGCDDSNESKDLSFAQRGKQLRDAGQGMEKTVAGEETQKVSMGSAEEAANACEIWSQSPLARALSSSQHNGAATATGSGAGSSHATATPMHVAEEALGSGYDESRASVGEGEPLTTRGETGEAGRAPKRKGAPLGIERTQKALKRKQPAQTLGVAVISPSSFAIVLDSGDEDDIFDVIDLT